MSIKSFLLDIEYNENLTNELIYQQLFNLEITSKIWKIIEFYLVLPISNAFIERGFSYMNLIKSASRSCMKDDLLDSILTIKHNGYEPKVISGDHPFIVEVEQHWRSQKIRKY